jgi:hypothetical protein
MPSYLLNLTDSEMERLKDASFCTGNSMATVIRDALHWHLSSGIVPASCMISGSVASGWMFMIRGQ